MLNKKQFLKTILVLLLFTYNLGNGLVSADELNKKTNEVENSLMANFKEEPHFGFLNGKSGTTINIYSNSTGSANWTYIENYSPAVGTLLILDESNSRYKISLAGHIGWVDKKHVNIVSYDKAKYYNYYQVNSEKELYHYVRTHPDANNGFSTVQGKAPDYLAQGKRYLSFDGHYFYEDTKSGINKMISDYNSGGRKGAINSSEPYYNYFQFLPVRSQSKLNSAEMRRMLVDNGFNTPKKSRLFEMEQYFIDFQNLFGGNAGIAFSTAVHESYYGSSNFARKRSNFFGHNAVDSKPDLATSYLSPSYGIRYHYTTYFNWRYLDGTSGNSLYYGGFLGNKHLGMNVMYASDPYWGEKIAQHYYRMDKKAGFKDYRRYTLGILNTKNVNVRVQPNLNSSISYTTKFSDIPVIVLDSVKGTTVNGSNVWYKIYSEHLLDKNNILHNWHSDGRYRDTKYDFNKNQIYIHSSFVDIVEPKGTDSTDLKVPKTNDVKFPSLETNPITGVTTAPLHLRPEWNTKFSPILTIPEGVLLEGYRTDNGWMKVMYDDHVGFISTDFINVIEDNSIKRKGDINNDGKIDVVDLAMITSHLRNIRKMTPDQIQRADINGDGTIDVVDLAMITSHLRNIRKIQGW